MDPHRPQALDHERRRGGRLHRLRQRRSRARATRASPRSSSSATSPASRSARRRTSSASARRAPRADPRRTVEVPAENVLGDGGQGLQDRDRDAQRGPHRHRRADDRHRAGRARAAPSRTSRSASSSGRPIAEFQGVQFQLAQVGDGARGRAADGLQRRAPQGRRASVREGGRDGEAVRLAGRRARHVAVRRAVRRVRLHEGLPASRSSTATRRSARSTRARRTCSSQTIAKAILR